MRFEAGYLVAGSWDGAPIRIHWSTPLAGFIYGAGRLAPAFWIGFILVLLVHELGHGLMVRRVGGTVEAIEVTGWGGRCEWSGDPMQLEDAIVAGGGVLAQAVVLILVAVAFVALGRPQNAFILQTVEVFVGFNLYVALVNLIPIEPLDGARAWPLIPYGLALLRERWDFAGWPARRARPRRRAEPPPDLAQIVRLQAQLDRDLNNILKQAAQPVSDDEGTGSPPRDAGPHKAPKPGPRS